MENIILQISLVELGLAILKVFSLILFNILESFNKMSKKYLISSEFLIQIATLFLTRKSAFSSS